VPYTLTDDPRPVPLQPVLASEFSQWLERAPERHQAWLRSSRFTAKPGKWCGLPAADGQVEAVVFGMQEEGWLYQLADLAAALPTGTYRLDSDWAREQRLAAALGWGLACYRFGRYKTVDSEQPRLYLEPDLADEVTGQCEAQYLVRDLVNTPTEDMGPAQLADALVAEADRFGADFRVIAGDDLLDQNFPAVHAVGRAAHTPPRFAVLEWGEPGRPLLALVGKGVCFDSGGLDIKPARGMALMKKDMGGAAHVLALARLVMQRAMPVRLMVLVPAVENAIAGNAYRPGDVVHTRKGLTVEIGNTDAEGRVVLSDALAFACEHGPDLLVDFATLTGAARVAMGPDVPPVFSNHAEIARALVEAGQRVEDPLWELPLYAPYRKMIDSEIADINNAGDSPYAGCITAALFLKEFVSPDTPWVHIDTFAWNLASRPGRPVGGEALGLRAVFHFLQQRYG